MTSEKFQSLLSDLSSALLVMMGFLVVYVVISRMKKIMRNGVIEDDVHWLEHSRFHRRDNDVIIEFEVPAQWNDDIIIRTLDQKGEILETIFSGSVQAGPQSIVHPMAIHENAWIEMESTGQRIMRRLQ